jgi:hypothetical protein
LRSAGGLLLAVGAVVLFIRKGNDHAWGDFALLLVVLIPAVVLYALALGGVEARSDRSEPWRSVLMVAAILLSPIVLAQLLTLFGADAGQALLTAGVFLATALIAAYGASRARVPYAVLLAGLASLVVWLIVWVRILGQPSVDSLRGLLIAAAALLMMVALRLARNGVIGARELAISGGVAAVAAGATGVAVGLVAGVTRPLTGILEESHPVGRVASASPTNGFQHFGWDLYLLAVSIALVWLGARVRARGLGYVGGFGLLAFLISVAAQVTRIESGHSPTSSFAGWPLALLLLGVAGLLAPVLYRREA